MNDEARTVALLTGDLVDKRKRSVEDGGKTCLSTDPRGSGLRRPKDARAELLQQKAKALCTKADRACGREAKTLSVPAKKQRLPRLPMWIEYVRLLNLVTVVDFNYIP